MKKRAGTRLIISLVVLLALTTLGLPALADGTEQLGPPSIEIASGSDHIAAGTGLISQPGEINIDVPAGEVKQVLLYWEGHGDCGDPGPPSTCELGKNISVGGQAIQGTLIGGPPTSTRYLPVSITA
jgi:predicted small secreted protein